MPGDDFEGTIKRIIKQHVEFYNMMWEFDPLDNGGAGGKDDISSIMEVACAAVLVRSASDMHRLVPKRLSKILSDGGSATHVLEQEFVTVAGIGMHRNDIPPLELRPHNLDEYAFMWYDDDHLCSIRINANADDKYLYNQREWQKERLDAIKACLDAGANIISLGEFDYPLEGDSSLTNKYEKEILRIIDGKDQPIFLVAGSRHEASSVVPGGSAIANEAKIFVNQVLADRPHLRLAARPFTYSKRTAARKVGERLSPPRDIDLQFYRTSIGSIVVLVCSDAYDPTIVFEILRQGAITRDQAIDFIIVPSYNTSAKLLYACQALSFLTKSTLLLVDACAEKRGEKAAEIELFVNGVRFDKCLKSRESAGQHIKIDHDRIRCWEISMDFLNESRQRSARPVTPFFDRVQSMLTRVPRSAEDAPLGSEH